MQEKLSTVFVTIGIALLLLGVMVYLAVKPRAPGIDSAGSETVHISGKGSPATLGDDRVLTKSGQYREAKDLMEDYLKLDELMKLLEDPHAIDGEAVLSFKSKEDYDKFLETAGELGLAILDRQSRSNSLRIGYDKLTDLHTALSGLNSDEYDVGANYLVLVPGVPLPGEPQNPGTPIVPFGDRTFEFLGINSDISTWGEGVRIAVLDSAVESHFTFKSGQIQPVDFLESPLTPGKEIGHGTAVASLVSGSDPEAPGLAPAANILSYNVLNAEGLSDSFTLSQAIYHAVDRGADIINISLGSLGDSSVLREAVAYAVEKNVSVVAAAGNEGIESLAYPAGYPGVVSVGAVDAVGQHVYYSNQSAALSVAAPGVGVQAAWPGNELVSFSGTSASTPYVSGAIAAILSQNRGLTAQQAQELLYAYTNEAGRPGSDSQFGNGILNIGRVMERNTSGIYDIAVASQTMDNTAVLSNTVNPMVNVAIQNRGTETLYNVLLQVNSAGQVRNFTIASMKPGEVVVKQAPIDSGRAHLEGTAEVFSITRLSTNGILDRNLRDNGQTTIISIVESQANAGP